METKTDQKQTRLTTDLREVLKNIMYTEIENIPTYIQGLEPKERLEVLIKIMPFVLPKVNSIHHTDSEPMKPFW